MRLSQRTTNAVMDFMCIAAPCINNILKDKELIETITAGVDVPGGTPVAGQLALFGDKICEFIPIVFGTHKTDLYGVVSAYQGITVDEVAEQPFSTTFGQVREMVTDPEAIDFFTSALRRLQKK